MELSNKDYAVVDMSNDDETLRGIVKLGKQLIGDQAKTTAKVGANSYTLAVGIVRLGLTTAECEDQGITSNRGVASKLATVGRVVAYAARTTDDGQDANLDAQVALLKRYWGLRVDELTAQGASVPMGFLEFVQGLNGDDGDRRVNAIKTATTMFGAASTFYSIAKGDRRHDSDVTDEQPGDDEGDNDEGDKPEQDPITYITAQLTMIRQYAEKHEVTLSEVSALFGQVFK